MKCIRCGAELAPEAQKCHLCGEEQETQKKCRFCGAVMAPNAHFCQRCGKDANTAEVMPNTKPKKQKSGWGLIIALLALCTALIVGLIVGLIFLTSVSEPYSAYAFVAANAPDALAFYM